MGWGSHNFQTISSRTMYLPRLQLGPFSKVCEEQWGIYNSNLSPNSPEMIRMVTVTHQTYHPSEVQRCVRPRNKTGATFSTPSSWRFKPSTVDPFKKVYCSGSNPLRWPQSWMDKFRPTVWLWVDKSTKALIQWIVWWENLQLNCRAFRLRLSLKPIQ